MGVRESDVIGEHGRTESIDLLEHSTSSQSSPWIVLGRMGWWLIPCGNKA